MNQEIYVTPHSEKDFYNLPRIKNVEWALSFDLPKSYMQTILIILASHSDEAGIVLSSPGYLTDVIEKVFLIDQTHDESSYYFITSTLNYLLHKKIIKKIKIKTSLSVDAYQLNFDKIGEK